VFKTPFATHLSLYSVVAIAAISNRSALAQPVPNLPNPGFERPTLPNSEPQIPTLPPPEQLLPTPNTPPTTTILNDFSSKIVVKKFDVTGSTVFSPSELQKIIASFTNRPIGFNELLQSANQITELYAQNGYINSGAFIPGNQTFEAQGGTVKIEIIEGSVEDIVVTGTQRLNPKYITSRIALGTNKPLKVDRLLESLRLLQLDPLIKNLSTELAAGREPSTSIIKLQVTENPTWRTGITAGNNRTPSVGELIAQANLSQNNLTGNGDSLALSYGRSEASNIYDINYTLPINPRNGTLKFQYSRSNSRVVENPFDRLDINGTAQDISIGYRQPLLQTTAQEFALGITIANRETNTGYLASIIGDRVGYPSPGADDNGVTRITAARLFQDYTLRDSQQVLAARSQVSFGVNTLDATVSPSSPNSNFVTWRGQGQYVRALAPNSILLLKLEGQIADRPLVALEQIGVGGQDTVRGYRQDLLLGDNGLLASAEVRIPIFTPADSKQVLQIVPFVDFGVISNQAPNLNPKNDMIASGGVGLRYQSGDNFFAKFDYGVPFTLIDQPKRTGQEKGLHFSMGYSQSF
jgi:hemolysin activation/secretion protein